MFPHTGEHDTRTKTCSSSLTSLTLAALTRRPVIAIKVEPLNNEREGGQEVIMMNIEVAVNLIVHCTHINTGSNHDECRGCSQPHSTLNTHKHRTGSNRDECRSCSQWVSWQYPEQKHYSRINFSPTATWMLKPSKLGGVGWGVVSSNPSTATTIKHCIKLQLNQLIRLACSVNALLIVQHFI